MIASRENSGEMEVRKGRGKRSAEVQSMGAVSTTFAPTLWIRMLPCNATVSEVRVIQTRPGGQRHVRGSS